jgi:hypothetical protein
MKLSQQIIGQWRRIHLHQFKQQILNTSLENQVYLSTSKHLFFLINFMEEFFYTSEEKICNSWQIVCPGNIRTSQYSHTQLKLRKYVIFYDLFFCK